MTRLFYIGLYLICSAVGVPAAPLAVVNFSFEDITGQPTFNEFTLVVPSGWTAYNPSNLVSGGGLYFGTLDTDGSFFDPAPNPAPDGDRVTILYNQNQKGAGEYGIEQTLAETLQPLMRYTLQAEVGNIGSGTSDSGDFFDLSNFPGYRIELLAGTNLLAVDNNSLLIPERTFSNSLVQTVVGPDTLGIGEALSIRLVNLNQPFEPDSSGITNDAHEVDFDHVRLVAEFVPELFSASNGASYAVLIDAGLVSTNSSAAAFEAASLLNTDGDIHFDWQEHITGTNPTNALSFFTNTLFLTDVPVVQWPVISNRTYSVWLGTNLSVGFSILTNGLSAGSYADHAATNRPVGFYRVEAEFP